jgi:peptidoglycan hydrolase-like amidase
MKRATFSYEMQVSGDKNSLVASIRNFSFFKNLKANVFKDYKTKKMNSNFAKKEKTIVAINNYGPSVKIKLAGFEKDYEEIAGSQAVVIWDKKERIAKVSAHTPIKIYLNKSIKKKEIQITVGDKKWNFSGKDIITFKTSGFLELLKYKNNRYGGNKLKYNKFRGKLHFKLGDNHHLMVINELPIEQYLWGLGEEPLGEPINKKHTVFILARSYVYVYSGKRRKFNRYDYDLEDDPRTSQLYLGYDWERYHNDQKDIIKQTSGKVLFSNKEKRAVIGPYFTQSAGYSVNPWRKQYPWARERELPFDRGLVQRGHGVGLSGNSARILAEKGATVKEIIDYFFDRLDIKKVY